MIPTWIIIACLCSVVPRQSFTNAFTLLPKYYSSKRIAITLYMFDPSMEQRLESIRRSYQALTERLGDPDVIADASLLMRVMSDRSKSEDVVQAYEEYRQLKSNLQGAQELFLSDDSDMREMARSEIKDIEPQMLELEKKIQLLLLPKDPNDDRNVMLEIRAGTGGSEANLFAGMHMEYLKILKVIVS